MLLTWDACRIYKFLGDSAFLLFISSKCLKKTLISGSPVLQMSQSSGGSSGTTSSPSLTPKGFLLLSCTPPVLICHSQLLHYYSHHLHLQLAYSMWAFLPTCLSSRSFRAQHLPQLSYVWCPGAGATTSWSQAQD